MARSSAARAEATKVQSGKFLWVSFWVALSTLHTFGATIAGPIIRPETGHLYYLLTVNTWTASEIEAITLGGHLATVNDAEENQWLYDTFIPVASGHDPIFQGRVHLWIGLSDAAEEGVYTWESGEPVSYTHWDVTQPNNNFNQDYVHLYGPISQFPATQHPGFWNDFGDTASTVDPPVGYFGVVETVPEATSFQLVLVGVLSYFIVLGGDQSRESERRRRIFS